MKTTIDIKALEQLAQEIEAGAEKDTFVSLALDPADNARVIYGDARSFFTRPGRNRIPFLVKGGKGISYQWIPQARNWGSDVDEAIRECERRGYYPRIDRCSPTEWRANIGAANKHAGTNGKAPTAARALTAALIRAVAAEIDAKENKGQASRS